MIYLRPRPFQRACKFSRLAQVNCSPIQFERLWSNTILAEMNIFDLGFVARGLTAAGYHAHIFGTDGAKESFVKALCYSHCVR